VVEGGTSPCACALMCFCSVFYSTVTSGPRDIGYPRYRVPAISPADLIPKHVGPRHQLWRTSWLSRSRIPAVALAPSQSRKSFATAGSTSFASSSARSSRAGATASRRPSAPSAASSSYRMSGCALHPRQSYVRGTHWFNHTHTSCAAPTTTHMCHTRIHTGSITRTPPAPHPPPPTCVTRAYTCVAHSPCTVRVYLFNRPLTVPIPNSSHVAPIHQTFSCACTRAAFK